MKPCIFLLIFFVCCTCSKKDEIDRNVLFNNTITIIGHGGAGFQTGRKPYPTNSLLSIHKAIDLYAAEGVEVDVQLSKDSVIVMFHDEFMDGYTSCSGYISDLNWNEIKRCRYREDFAVSNFLDERIASLEELLKIHQFAESRPYIFLDTKYYQNSQRGYYQFYKTLEDQIVALCKTYNYQNHLIVESHDLLFLLKVKKRIPELQVFFGGNFEKDFELVVQNGLDGMTLKNNEVSKEQVSRAHLLNKKIAIFLINDRKTTVDAISKNPDFIQTDNILLAQQVLMH